MNALMILVGMILMGAGAIMFITIVGILPGIFVAWIGWWMMIVGISRATKHLRDE